MGNAGATAGFQFLMGFVLIAVLTWFAGISKDTGHVAIAVILALWFLWFLTNQSKLAAFAGKFHA